MSRRHNPLAEDLSPTVKPYTKATTSHTRKRKSRSFEENGSGYIDASSSRKILAMAKDLGEADAAERDGPAVPNAAFIIKSRSADGVAADDQDEHQGNGESDGSEWMPDEDLVEEDVDPADLSVYRKFFSQSADV
jgi:essential nuclear protein 1